MGNNTLDMLLENGVIAIARGVYGEKLLSAASALMRGGVRAVEVTFDQRRGGADTVEAIRLLKAHLGGGMAVGAGTVLTLEQLALALEAGAEYVVSPNTDERIIRETKRMGLVSVPGAMTPTEIAFAASCGADIVKLFPAGSLGAGYFSAVTTPLSHIRCAAVGGVTLLNIAAFRRAGACAFGISSSLFDKALIDGGDFEAIGKNAEAFILASRKV